MSKGKPNKGEVIEFTEAEKKALEKLEHSHLLREKQILQDRIEELHGKIYDLSEEIRLINENNLRLTLKMESDINVKQDELGEMNNQFEIYRKNMNESLERLREEKDLRIKQLMDEKNQLNNEFERKVDYLEGQIQNLSTFRERETGYIQTIEDLNRRMKDKEYAHHDELLKNQKNFQKQTQNLNNVNSAKIEDILRNADRMAEQKVADKYESIQKENKKIRQEMEIYIKELDEVKKDCETYLMENQNLRQNLSIQQESAKEYQLQNHQQILKIKKLKQKIEYLKNYISNEVTKYTKEIELMKHQSNTRIQELEMQLRNLKHLLEQRTKELKTVKALAQMILDQRSDIEQFFLQAIDQVKNEIKKKNLHTQKSRLPEITQKSHSMDAQKVDLNDLDLEEKEKLLRILFSKMNQGVPPQNWKSQLSHSKSQADGSSFRDNQFN